MRRAGRWNENHAVEPELLAGFLRDTQVCEVDGIEGASKKADPLPAKL